MRRFFFFFPQKLRPCQQKIRKIEKIEAPNAYVTGSRKDTGMKEQKDPTERERELSLLTFFVFFGNSKRNEALNALNEAVDEDAGDMRPRRDMRPGDEASLSLSISRCSWLEKSSVVTGTCRKSAQPSSLPMDAVMV